MEYLGRRGDAVTEGTWKAVLLKWMGGVEVGKWLGVRVLVAECCPLCGWPPEAAPMSGSHQVLVVTANELLMRTQSQLIWQIGGDAGGLERIQVE